MSAPNFYTMPLFPLYVYDDENFYHTYCPDCFEPIDEEDPDECPLCGAQLGYEDRHFHHAEADYFFDTVNEAIDEVNSELSFFRISLKSGYYAHAQFYVTLTDHADSAGFTAEAFDFSDVENEDTHYYFDCCRSVAIRKFEREQRKVEKALENLANEYGFEKLSCVGIFSNGEAVYERAS